MAAKVFISYRRADSRYQARMIHAAFCQAVPRDHVFMDVDSIPLGANFRNTLKEWVDQCEILLALIGPGWTNATDPNTGERRLDDAGDFVRIEISEALARDIPVVPVLLDGTPMPDPNLLPPDLRGLIDRQAEFVEYRTFDVDVARLIRKLGLGRDSGHDPAKERPAVWPHDQTRPQPADPPTGATAEALNLPAEPKFGTPGAVFSVGVWRIAKRPIGTELYFWTEDRSKAVELTADSFGWWKLRRGSEEKLVWPLDAHQSRDDQIWKVLNPDAFADRFWLSFQAPARPISTLVHSHKGRDFATRISIVDGKIKIAFADRSGLELDAESTLIYYKSSKSDVRTY
jgi:hypothetical protein